MFFVFLPHEEELPKKNGGSEHFQRLTVPIFGSQFLFFKNSRLPIFSLIKLFERNGLTYDPWAQLLHLLNNVAIEECLSDGVIDLLDFFHNLGGGGGGHLFLCGIWWFGSRWQKQQFSNGGCR